MNQLLTRAQAKASGAVRYFTGKPCKRGHISERLTVNGSCYECDKLKAKSYYHANRDASLKAQKAYREKHPERAAQQLEKRYALDPALRERAELRKHEKELQLAAQTAGLSMYGSTQPCAHGHIGRRFSLDRKCVECNRIACLKRTSDEQREAFYREIDRRKAEREAKSEALQAIRSARARALSSGAVTYQGSLCSRGHSGIRYRDGSCVECSRNFSTSPEKKAYDYEYYRNNIDRIKIRGKAYFERNRDRINETVKRWVKRNPEKRKIISHAYDARRRSKTCVGDSHAKVLQWSLAAPKICYWCNCDCSKAFHIDHYEPLSRGGLHVTSNLVIACPRCNLKKNAKDPYDFAKSVGRLF